MEFGVGGVVQELLVVGVAWRGSRDDWALTGAHRYDLGRDPEADHRLWGRVLAPSAGDSRSVALRLSPIVAPTGTSFRVRVLGGESQAWGALFLGYPFSF